MGMEITLSGISRSFGDRAALTDIGCVFPDGLISAVIGPNGSGKSTLIRIMARLDTPDRGVVEYKKEGRHLAAGLSLMRRMTLAAQRPTLFNATLWENIAYGLKARGLSEEEVDRRAAEALDAGGLSSLADARATTLSGGEAQRAALVRAYALGPDAAYLDEPTANMDPDNTALAERLIMKMNQDTGTSVVMVTHNLFQTKRLADRVFFMFGGALVEYGETRAVFENPRHELTAKYVAGELVC